MAARSRVHAPPHPAGRPRGCRSGCRADARMRRADLGRTLAPVWLAAVAIGLSNTLFSAANSDPTTTTLAMIGPSGSRSRPSPTGSRRAPDRGDRVRRCGVHVDHRLHPSGRLARPAGASPHGSPTGRWPPTRRSRASRRTWRRSARRAASAGCAALASAAVHRTARACDPPRRSHGGLDGRPGVRGGPRTHYRVQHWTWLDAAVGVWAVVILIIALSLGR